MNYEITEEQIKELAKGNAKVKKMFPEVFETKFESGWYKYKEKPSIWWLAFIDEDFYYYGFNETVWFDKSNNKLMDININNYTPATDSEVLEALTNEAIKRGFKEGVFVKTLWGKLDYWKLDTNRFTFNSETNNLHLGPCVFNDGKWAEIIKTYTKEEAEKMLNAKII